MEFKEIILWLAPLFIIIAALFTSAIKKYTYQRYSIYFVMILSAFLLDLQSLSFPVDILDTLFSLIVLLIVADFFWRGIRLKHKLLKALSLLIGLILLVITYKTWVLEGPKTVKQHIFSKVLEHSCPPVKGFHIKQRALLATDTTATSCLELYKKRTFSLLEQKLSTYAIAEGYENATFAFRWRFFEHRIAADVIADPDTIWTLTDPGPPK